VTDYAHHNIIDHIIDLTCASSSVTPCDATSVIQRALLRLAAYADHIIDHYVDCTFFFPEFSDTL